MKMQKYRFFISAGEISGDILASELMKALSAEADVKFYGLGGAKMFDAGLNSITEDISHTSTVGFLESLEFFIRKYNLLNNTVKYIKNNSFDAAILVDNQGFNIPLAEKCAKMGLKTIYYIAPHVSVWGRWNAGRLAKSCDLIFPFIDNDHKVYSEYTDKSRFFGNQIALRVMNYKLNDSFYKQANIDRARRTIGLFPGSRKHEIKMFMDIMLRAADRLIKERSVNVLLSVSHSKYRKDIEKMINNNGLAGRIECIENSSYEIMNAADVNIMSSGTATLESALFRKPPIICYKISPLSYQIGKRLVKNPIIGLPNILLNKVFFPELVQNDLTVKKIVDWVNYYLDISGRDKADMEEAFDKVKAMAYNSDAMKRITESIFSLIKATS